MATWSIPNEETKMEILSKVNYILEELYEKYRTHGMYTFGSSKEFLHKSTILVSSSEDWLKNYHSLQWSASTWFKRIDTEL
jgi:hypothetical protein